MTDKEFIDTWNAADSPSEVSAAIGTTNRSVIHRASRLRKSGQQVTRFAAGPLAYREPYLPTPEEIAAETKKIRDGWNKTTTSNNMRSDWKTNGVSFKPIKVAIDGRRLFIKEDY